MNRLAKMLSVFMIMTLVAVWGSLAAYAQAGGQTATSVPDLTSSAVPSKAASSQRASSSPPRKSSAPSVSSKAYFSSRTSRRTVKRKTYKVLSSDVSSSQVDSEKGAGGLLDSASSSEISLPSVASVSEANPLASAGGNSTRGMTWIGILSWACIVLGVIVVLIVVFSNRRPPRGMGRKRYRKPRRSRKKRLLNDKYYRNINR